MTERHRDRGLAERIAPPNVTAGTATLDAARLVDLLPEAFVAVDFGGHVVLANQAWRELVGPFAGPDGGSEPLSAAHPDDRPEILDAFRRARAGEAVQVEHRMATPDGRHRWVRWRAFADQEQRLIFVLGRDVTAERLDALAGYDSLTGLFDRVATLEHLATVLWAPETEGTVAVLACRLDPGPSEASGATPDSLNDELRIAAAGRLRAALRATDVVGRFGDDQFVVIATEAGSGDDVLAVAERLTQVLGTSYRTTSGREALTVTIGIVVCGPGASASEVIVRAVTSADRARRPGRSLWALAPS